MELDAAIKLLSLKYKIEKQNAVMYSIINKADNQRYTVNERQLIMLSQIEAGY